MSKLPYLACAAALLLLGAKPQNEMFSKYKSVEAYEIRPGVLAMPRYTEDGEVCEIGVAKSAYSPEMIRLGTSFTHEEIESIVDLLVPSDERGPKTPMFGTMNENVTSGVSIKKDDPSPASASSKKTEALETGSIQTTESYENVTVLIYEYVENMDAGNVAFTLTWTKRDCPRPAPTLSMYR